MEKSIKQTFDYDQFKLLNWNRPIKASNLKKIAKSVEKSGWLKHPIMVNERMEVIDGQHRLEFAKENNLPVYYIVIPNIGIDDCVTMNNVRATWTLIDYINLYASQGNDNYIILKNLLETYTFLSPTTLLCIINEAGFGGGQSAAVKDGSYEITAKQHDRAIAKLEMLSRCSDVIMTVQGRASAIYAAISFAYDCPGVDKRRLEKQIKTNIGIITPPANVEMAMKEIEYLYNYRISKENYVYIATEYKKKAADNMLSGSRSLKGKKLK